MTSFLLNRMMNDGQSGFMKMLVKRYFEKNRFEKLCNKLIARCPSVDKTILKEDLLVCYQQWQHRETRAYLGSEQYDLIVDDEKLQAMVKT